MISIIIPNLHSPLIDQVVESLQRQTAPELIGEIIVVGQDRYGKVPASVCSIVTPRPYSAAEARNLGVREARGEILLFLDADCIAAPDLVERIWAARQAGHAVVGGSITIERGPYWRLCDNLLGFAGYLSTDPAGPRDYLPTLNLCLPRAVVLEVGGFDPRFLGAAGEDAELGMRLRAAGYTMHFEPRATLYHRSERLTPGAVWRHLQSYGRATMAARYGELRLAPRLTPRLRPLGSLIRAASPVLALWDLLGMLAQRPELRSYGYTFPGVLWARVAWYWGVVDGLLARPAGCP